LKLVGTKLLIAGTLNELSKKRFNLFRSHLMKACMRRAF